MTDSLYLINEVFLSLQGEGFHTGMPAVFVRFGLCNLHCPFCDTDFAHTVSLTAEQIADKITSLNPPKGALLVLTGGEPTLQIDAPLLACLRRLGMLICIETNGTRPVIAGVDWVTCSPKEGSKVVLTRVDELKVVFLGDGKQQVERWREQIKADHYFLQPLSGQNTDEVMRYLLSPDTPSLWRLSLQTHKLINIR